MSFLGYQPLQLDMRPFMGDKVEIECFMAPKEFTLIGESVVKMPFRMSGNELILGREGEPLKFTKYP